MTNTAPHEKKMRPFFSFYGGKYRIAPRYPVPLQESIIEPFAGSAGFSLRYPSLQVFLYDIDPVICGVWDYLITATENEILSLPDIDQDKTLNDYELPQEAKWLIGFNLNKGAASPSKSMALWGRQGGSIAEFWGVGRRERIAKQQPYIRHWRIENKPYWEIENRQAYWFVDPPYNNKAGSYYKHSNVDYRHLADWCKTRHGDVVVCENDGADWLPFQPFFSAKANHVNGRSKNISKEVIWTSK